MSYAKLTKQRWQNVLMQAGEGRVLGNDRFREQIELMLNRRLAPQKRGPKGRAE